MLFPLHNLISNRGFDRFQKGLESRFQALELKYELTYCEPTPNPAMRLDFESEIHWGCVTVWESGLCDLEVLEIESGQCVLYEHHELQSEIEFLSVYPTLIVFMRDALGWPKAN